MPSIYLTDDDGNFLTDDDGDRLVVELGDEETPPPSTLMPQGCM